LLVLSEALEKPAGDGFSSKSKEAFPKTEVLEKPQFIVTNLLLINK
jgi:hypothetical protein